MRWVNWGAAPPLIVSSVMLTCLTVGLSWTMMMRTRVVNTSFPLLFAAIALLSDSVWVYVAGLATFLYLHIGLIPVEEAVLRAAHDWMHEEYVRTVPMYTHCEWLLSTSWPAFVLWCSRLSRCCLRRRRRAE